MNIDQVPSSSVTSGQKLLFRKVGGDRALSYLKVENVISLQKYGREFFCTPYETYNKPSNI